MPEEDQGGKLNSTVGGGGSNSQTHQGVQEFNSIQILFTQKQHQIL